MPEYDYKCENCKTVTSVFTRSVKDELHPVCSVCKSTNMTRQISSVAFRVKGRSAGAMPLQESMQAQFEQMGVPLSNTMKERIDRQNRGESSVPMAPPAKLAP
ncbi:MAG: zinc ribbon domain-containing protein [Dehalococcoidia bacterium]|nr:zinc ribbon domain-containing protein [Dehalococcoidia bacterium]